MFEHIQCLESKFDLVYFVLGKKAILSSYEIEELKVFVQSMIETHPELSRCIVYFA